MTDVLLPEFHADVSHYKDMRVHCIRYEQNMHLFAAILRTFGPGRQNFNTRDLSSAYIQPYNFIRIC